MNPMISESTTGVISNGQMPPKVRRVAMGKMMKDKKRPMAGMHKMPDGTMMKNSDMKGGY